jgi:molybdate transport system ATP-binding protein
MIRFSAHKPMQTARGKQTLDISFELEPGRLLALYGPSGTGKTTLLRMLAGLTDPGKGHIEAYGETWYDSKRKINLPPQARSVGMVFQDFALFPHLTVRENLKFALQKGDDGRIVDELLDQMELGQLQRRKPAALSGGQRQRVALARAIVRAPRLLLLDEPLSALDTEMRLRLQAWLRKTHRERGLTTILVSHHLPEVLQLADQVISIDNGIIQKKGKPAELFGSDRSIY